MVVQAISTITQRSGLKVAPNPAIARRGKHQSDGGSDADLETAQTVLGWKPSTALEAGLEATLPSVARHIQRTKTLVILIGQVIICTTFCSYAHGRGAATMWPEPMHAQQYLGRTIVLRTG